MKKKHFIQTLAVTGFTAFGLFTGASHSFAIENEASSEIGINEALSLETIGGAINDQLLKATYSNIENINLSPANQDVSVSGETSVSSTAEETTGAQSSSGNLNMKNGLSAEKNDDASSTLTIGTDVSAASTNQVLKEASASAFDTGVDVDITNNVDNGSASLKLDKELDAATVVGLEEEISSSELDSGLNLAATNDEVVDSSSLDLAKKLDEASDVLNQDGVSSSQLDSALNVGATNEEAGVSSLLNLDSNNGVSSSQLGSALNVEATNEEVDVSSLLDVDSNNGVFNQEGVSSSQLGTEYDLGVMSNVNTNSSLTLASVEQE